VKRNGRDKMIIKEEEENMGNYLGQGRPQNFL
jgi:hypothetical protein